MSNNVQSQANYVRPMTALYLHPDVAISTPLQYSISLG